MQFKEKLIKFSITPQKVEFFVKFTNFLKKNKFLEKFFIASTKTAFFVSKKTALADPSVLFGGFSGFLNLPIFKEKMILFFF